MAQPWTHTIAIPKWVRGEKLFSAVPWLKDDMDLRPYGAVETTIEHGNEITLGLLVPDPFGKSTTAMLSIRNADWRKGGVADLTLAITNVLRFDVQPKPGAAIPINLSSGPLPAELDDNGANDPGD